MSIQWYPGHMAKAKRELKEQLGYADVVVEICDARIPLSSRNPDLNEMTSHKKRILLLNKADLADPAATKGWMRYFQLQGLMVMALTSYQHAKKVFPLIEAAAQEKLSRGLARGINRTIRAVVVGVPNVGKSTLINSMKGKASLKTADKPGVTRSVQWFPAGKYLELMDSPGLLWPRLDDARAARRLAFIGSIRDEVHDLHKLAIELLAELMNRHPQALIGRYKLEDGTLRGEALLEAICISRGFLLKGGAPDFDRAVVAVLDEFRDGSIGRITLEYPPEVSSRAQEL